MLKLLRAENGMNIVGQGLKIMVFTAPAVMLAVLLHLRMPGFVNLPIPLPVRIPLGIIFLVSGLTLWTTGVVQLLIGFPKGKLITTGAYGVCRNPIYSSFVVFILPAISFLSGTWAYLIVSLFMYIGVVIFIRKEERQLGRVFGNDYEAYKKRVSRIMPLLKPQR